MHLATWLCLLCSVRLLFLLLFCEFVCFVLEPSGGKFHVPNFFYSKSITRRIVWHLVLCKYQMP